MVEATQEKRRAVVLVIDRLGAGYLGPFGNTWIDTPCFNQLASQSLLVRSSMDRFAAVALALSHPLAGRACGF